MEREFIVTGVKITPCPDTPSVPVEMLIRTADGQDVPFYCTTKTLREIASTSQRAIASILPSKTTGPTPDRIGGVA